MRIRGVPAHIGSHQLLYGQENGTSRTGRKTVHRKDKGIASLNSSPHDLRICRTTGKVVDDSTFEQAGDAGRTVQIVEKATVSSSR